MFENIIDCNLIYLFYIYIYILLILYFYTVFFLEIECKAHLKTLRWICAIEENKLLNYYYYLWKFFVLSLKTRKKFQRANLTSIRYAANESTLCFRLHYLCQKKCGFFVVFSFLHNVALESCADPLFHCNYWVRLRMTWIMHIEDWRVFGLVGGYLHNSS